MGKLIELILGTNDDHPSIAIINHLTIICSMLKKVSDKSFKLRLLETDDQQVSPEIASIEMELEKLYHEIFLKIYKYGYDKLMVKHAKWWTVFEEFRTQSLEWEQRRGVGGREKFDVAELVGPYQSVFTDLVQFREKSVALQSSLSECCQTEKVGLMEMKLLTTRWQWMIVCANNILDNPTACEYWAAKVALDGELPFPHSSDPSNDEIGPVLQLRRAIEKLVAFHNKVLTLMNFAALAQMRALFFSTEIRVTPVEKNRPALLRWPSSKREWMNLLSTIYTKQGFERETGQIAIDSEQNLVEKAAEHERAETVHCECAVVAYLHPYNSSPAFFYIGLSRSPCKPSCIWMKAYNDAAGTIFHTKGTNHKWYKGWARPGLGQAEFQEKLDAKFQEMMENELCMGQMDLGLARNSSDFDIFDWGG